MSAKIKEGNFETYIASSFLKSNFGVIKCYKLVFGIKGKLNNIGFWLFGIMILFHFPLYTMYFIRGISPIKKYINNEMDNNGYKSSKSLDCEKETITKMETTSNEDNKIITFRRKRAKTKSHRKSNIVSSLAFNSNALYPLLLVRTLTEEAFPIYGEPLIIASRAFTFSFFENYFPVLFFFSICNYCIIII
jgi:hypothetical protein